MQKVITLNNAVYKPEPNIRISDDEKWQAVIRCDEKYDGLFYYGVKTTGIFCRPSCRAKNPLRDNGSRCFKEIHSAAKAPPGSDSIFFVHSTHVEAVIMMTYCGKEKK